MSVFDNDEAQRAVMRVGTSGGLMSVFGDGAASAAMGVLPAGGSVVTLDQSGNLTGGLP